MCYAKFSANSFLSHFCSTVNGKYLSATTCFSIYGRNYGKMHKLSHQGSNCFSRTQNNDLDKRKRTIILEFGNVKFMHLVGHLVLGWGKTSCSAFKLSRLIWNKKIIDDLKILYFKYWKSMTNVRMSSILLN